MGAIIDSNEKFYFISDIGVYAKGATVVGTPTFALPGRTNALMHGIENTLSTWLVCSHLSSPDKVYNYYMSSGLIILVLGKCICEKCLDTIVVHDNLNEVLRTSTPMTDAHFQQNFIVPLIQSNVNFSRSVGYIGDGEESPKTWVSCSHLSTPHGLKEMYSNGGQICIFESYLTCHECFDKIPSESLVDILYEGISMTDDLFQENIIAALYSINSESLEAVGHFDIRRYKL